MVNAFWMLLGGFIVVAAAVWLMYIVLFYKLNDDYWSRSLSGLRGYVNGFNIQILLAAWAAGVLWFAWLRTQYKQWIFNVFATSLLLPVALPLIFVSPFAFFILAVGGHMFWALLLIIPVPIATYLLMVFIVRKVPELSLSIKTFSRIVLLAGLTLCFLVSPFHNQRLRTLSETRRHQRAVNYFGETYLQAYETIQTCPNFLLFSGELHSFVPALESASEIDMVSLHETSSLWYTFDFVGELTSGKAELSVWFDSSWNDVYFYMSYDRNRHRTLECDALNRQFERLWH
jgi:hypothetical protein